MGVAVATGARVSRAKVAGGIVPGPVLRRGRFDLAMPGPFCAVRGNENPVPSKTVEAAMRMIHEKTEWAEIPKLPRAAPEHRGAPVAQTGEGE